MLNPQPVFVLGFQRGGTDLLWYLLLSHPRMGRTRGETHQLFRGKWGKGGPRDAFASNLRRLARYLPVLLLQREDVFSPRLLRPRRPFTRLTERLVDRAFFQARLQAREPQQNLYRARGVRYTAAELRETRLLAKNVNGLVFLTPNLQAMYPDARFVVLVRNGFAVCEGLVRRGMSVHDAARLYALGCRRMLDDARDNPRVLVLRFEDLLDDPPHAARRVYRHCGLDIGEVEEFRFVAKPVASSGGAYAAPPGTVQGELVWCALHDLERYLRRDVNRRQIERLGADARAAIARAAGDELRALGYLQGENS